MNITKVELGNRIKFLPKHFPAPLYLNVEQAIYTYASHFIDGYCGGYWEFYELGKRKAPLMLFKKIDEPIILISDFGTVYKTNTQTASIAINLMVINHLVFEFYATNKKNIAEHLQRVYENLDNWVFGAETAEEVEAFNIDRRVISRFLD